MRSRSELTRRYWTLGTLGLVACRPRARPSDYEVDEIPPQFLNMPDPAHPATPMRTRPIPRTGELLPVIGLSSGLALVSSGAEVGRVPMGEVLRVLIAAGGRAIDAFAAEEDAERITGELLKSTGVGSAAFLAARVQTRGKQAGQVQMEQSLRRLGRRNIDLMQVHDLTDFATQIQTLVRWRVIGHARYIGATVSRVEDLPALEQAIKSGRLDFVQVPFSIVARAAHERVLPLAADHGVAVLVSRPLAGGRVFDAVRHRPLPDWARGVECSTWSQIFLKWILSHDEVHCILPATSNPRHMADNVGAGFGPLLDSSQRRALVEIVDGP